MAEDGTASPDRLLPPPVGTGNGVPPGVGKGEVGPPPGDPSFADESEPGVDIKSLHDRLPMLTNDELARLSVLEPGTRLEQGGVYLDLNHRDRGPFQAIGGEVATSSTLYIAKRDTDYLLWNRLAGQDAEPDIERP